MKQNKYYFYSFAVLLVSTLSLFSQQNNTPTKWDVFKDDVGIGFNDAGRYFSSPYQIPSVQSAVTMGLVGIVVGNSIENLDKMVNETTYLIVNDKATTVLNYSNALGELYTPIALSVSLYGIGLFFEEPSTRVTGRLMAEAFLFSGITTTVGKSFFGRSRPFVNRDPKDFYWFQRSEPHLSFPSGHATIAFSMASVLSSRIDNIYASIGLYSIATSTAVARIYKDKHWLSDVMLGSAIGIASGLYVCSLEEERSNPNKNQTFRWQLSPTFNGVNLTLRW